jgi:hypothetical protein
VYDAVFDDINLTQRSKIVCFANSQFSEVWWFYPSAGATENDKYVHFNIQEGHWNIGTLSRLACTDRGVFNNPMMVDATGYVYDHETGTSYDSVTPYATSGPLELGVGDRIAKVQEIIPDEATLGQAQVSFIAADSPTGAETTYGPYTPASFTQARFAARQAKMKVEFTDASGARWGNPRIEVRAGGRR